MKFGEVNKLTVLNRFVLHTLQRNIKHLAVITRKTNIKLGILKRGELEKSPATKSGDLYLVPPNKGKRFMNTYLMAAFLRLRILNSPIAAKYFSGQSIAQIVKGKRAAIYQGWCSSLVSE